MNFNFSGAGDLAGPMMVLTLAVMLLEALVHVVFAFAVYSDAGRTRQTVFVGPGIWALATLLGGVFVAVAYWALHHSTLRGQQGP